MKTRILGLGAMALVAAAIVVSPPPRFLCSGVNGIYRTHANVTVLNDPLCGGNGNLTQIRENP